MGDAEEKRFANSLARHFAEHLLALGLLSEADFKDRKNLVKTITEHARNTDFVPVLDHTESILDAAKAFAETHDHELSIMLYATYFEHAFNNLLDYHLATKRVKEMARSELLRAVNMNGKCGWVLEILGLPAFNAKHAKVVLDVAATRNAFVHYKWKPMRDTEIERHAELIKEAKKTVTYTKRYTSRVLFGARKGRLHKVLTSP